MGVIAQVADHGPVQWMRDLLGPWLQDKAWEPKVLVRWLQGYDLPPVGPADEPYLWLLRGLPLGRNRRSAESELARRIAHILAGHPDESSIGDRPEQVRFNLLKLCAGLSCPDELAEPLYAMYQRQKLAAGWRGQDLRDTLIGALVANQIDARMETVWQAMLAGTSDGFLPGGEDDGFDGIVLMPRSRETRGQPALDAIGRALRRMADILDRERERRSEFRKLITQTLQTYPGRSNWHEDLVRLADEHRWAGWAVECLPSLVLLAPGRDGLTDGLVWHYVAACVPTEQEYVITAELCGGHVLVLRMPATTVPIVQLIASVVEPRRVGNPYPSDRSMVGAVSDGLAELELRMEQQQLESIRTSVQRARLAMLSDFGVRPRTKEIGSALQKIASSRESDSNRDRAVRALAEAIVEVYPRLDLKREARARKLAAWAIECLPARAA